jgi:DNA-binding MarR family transcriptional regulator
LDYRCASNDLDIPVELVHSLHWQIELTHRSLSRLWEQKLQASVGLSFPQARAILALKAEGRARLGRLSERLGCDIGAMSRVVSRIESKGLVERSRDPFDTRCLQLSLTARGKMRANEIRTVLGQIEGDALSKLTASERERFVEYLKRIAG